MTYRIMIFAGRKAGISHDEFKRRYEQHIHLVAEISGNTAPLKHTRWYPKHEGSDDKLSMLAGDPETLYHDVIAELVFEDEAAFGRFHAALTTEEGTAKIEADEAGFWDRNRMNIVVIGDVEEWKN